MESFMRWIGRIYRCAGIYRGEKLAAEGVSSCQHIYIFHICRTPGITQEQLSRRLCVNKSSVTRQLVAMEQGGLIRRGEDSEDRRVQHVYPTPRADGLYPQVRALMEEWNRLLLEELSDTERAALQSMLSRIAARAEALVVQAGPAEG